MWTNSQRNASRCNRQLRFQFCFAQHYTLSILSQWLFVVDEITPGQLDHQCHEKIKFGRKKIDFLITFLYSNEGLPQRNRKEGGIIKGFWNNWHVWENKTKTDIITEAITKKNWPAASQIFSKYTVPVACTKTTEIVNFAWVWTCIIYTNNLT